jgi:hypothetical protein
MNTMKQINVKHTPGSWIFDDRHIHPKSGLTYPPGIDPETDVIVMVDTDYHNNGLLNETDKANLRLISAAPDLLEACRAFYDAFRWPIATDPLRDEAQPGHPMQEAWLLARAAIAKAQP